MSPPDERALLGKVLAGYRLVQLLGNGGTADVYLGEPADGARAPGGRGDPRGRVAVKVLRAEHRDRPDLVRRFEREAMAAARVRHPNVLEVLGEPVDHDGILGFPMELLVGLDVADTLAYSRSLDSLRAVKIACGAAEGLGAAHAAGIIHRDVKPENIFLVHAADGREAVKLLDFGFAWMPGDEARAGEPAQLSGASPHRAAVFADAPPAFGGLAQAVVGTPEFMAPEQAQGAPAHPTADVYSLGVVLYEMLAGQVPFSGPYPDIAHLHAVEAPPPIRRAPLSPALLAVVDRALAKDPAARFPSMAELRAALVKTPEAGRL